MKSIYMALALVSGLAIGAHAQKNLKIELLKPTANQMFSNTPDSIYYQVKITNMGPDTIKASAGDTLHVLLDISYFGCVLQNIKWLEDKVPANILPNSAVTFNITTKVGGQFWNDPDAPKVSVTPDSKWCPKAGVYGTGVNSTGGDVFFAGNPGVNTAAINDAYSNATTQAQLGDMVIAALSGDNLSTVTGVTFGSGATNKCSSTTDIIDFSGTPKTGLNIYPNPASSEVRIKHTISGNEHVTVKVTDITGRQLMIKDFGKQSAGEKEFTLDVTSLQNGFYYVELITDNARAISKMTIRK